MLLQNERRAKNAAKHGKGSVAAAAAAAASDDGAAAAASDDDTTTSYDGAAAAAGDDDAATAASDDDAATTCHPATIRRWSSSRVGNGTLKGLAVSCHVPSYLRTLVGKPVSCAYSN